MRTYISDILEMDNLESIKNIHSQHLLLSIIVYYSNQSGKQQKKIILFFSS